MEKNIHVEVAVAETLATTAHHGDGIKEGIEKEEEEA